MQKYVRVGLSIVALIIVACSLLVSFATRKANKIVDEANTAVTVGNQFAEQGGAKYAELFTEPNIEGFPGNREQLAPTATSLAELMEKATVQYDLAAANFEQASQEGVKQVIADYWKLKAQGFRKFAESKKTFRSVALLVTDETISSIDALNEKLSPLIDQAVKLDEEAKELAAQADKLQSENQDEFR